MGEALPIRLLRTTVGIVVGFLLMGAAVALAYQGAIWLQSSQRILGVIVFVAVGPVLEVCTHVIGIRTIGLGRGIMMGMLAGMIMGGRLVAQRGGGLWAAVFIPLLVFFSALFAAWVRERFSPRKEM
jgi:hypothetical protein